MTERDGDGRDGRDPMTEDASGDRTVRPIECARAMRAIHDRLDGAESDARTRDDDALAAHLSACAECRDAERAFLDLRRAMREVRVGPLPDDALREVWAATVDAPGATVAKPARSRAARGLAALAGAAAVVLAVVALVPGPPSDEPTSQDVSRAREELQLALAWTSRALERTRTAAVDDVLRDEVAPAIGRVRGTLRGGGIRRFDR